MKSYTIIIALSALALSSIETFAQGKVSISSTSQQLLTYSTDPAKLLPADAAKAGTVVVSRNAGSTAGDFKFQLWGASGNTATLDQSPKNGGRGRKFLTELEAKSNGSQDLRHRWVGVQASKEQSKRAGRPKGAKCSFECCSKKVED
jgi:hypothetical protein